MVCVILAFFIILIAVVIPNGKYNDAIALMEAGQYAEAISTGDYHTVGLKADGTLMAVGKNDDGQCDVSVLTGIQVPKK